MTARGFALVLCVVLGACSTMPPPQDTFYFDENAMAPLPSAPMIEYPPIEPVPMPPPIEPPPASESDSPRTATSAQPPPAASDPAKAADATPASKSAPEPRPTPESLPTQPPIVVATLPQSLPKPPPTPPEDLDLLALMADLNRYSGLAADDVKRELASMTQVFGRERSDANRVRLAMLYTMTRSPQDDLRAMQLLDNVAKSGGPATPVKYLASVLQVQVAERTRAVRDEQARANEAMQKLEALRQMERSLLRDRISSGGGGAGGGSGGGGH